MDAGAGVSGTVGLDGPEPRGSGRPSPCAGAQECADCPIRPRHGPARFAAAALAATALVTAPGALAQRAEPPSSDGGAAATEAYAPEGHWSREALRRLAGLGLVDPGAALHAWPLRRSNIRILLAESVQRAESRRDPALVALASGFQERFELDFAVPPALSRFAFAGRAGTGWAAGEGRLRGGASVVGEEGPRYPGPEPVPDFSQPFLAGAVDVMWLPAVVGSVELVGRGGEARLSEAYVSTRLGVLDVWAGRRGLSLGAGHGGGVVLHEGSVFDGGGVEIARGIVLPWIFRHLGPVRGLLSLARMDRSGPVEDPWFLGGRISFSPHPSLSFGVNRGTIFGGEGNQAVTPGRVLLMLLGAPDTGSKDSDFENTVVSLDAAWSTRVGGWPLALYAEWGFDDAGRALIRVPGLVLGAETAAVPGLPQLALGLEHVRFSASCCGHPPWYQHAVLAEGWTDRGTLLGHPLGGHGQEWALVWRADLLGPGVLLGGRLAARDRGGENLLAPDRAGSSVGWALDVRGFATRALRVLGRLGAERGRAGWWEWAASAAVQLFL